MNVQTSPAKPAGSRERSLEEVKAEFMRRVGRFNPFEDIHREDAERVMNALTNLDKDRWAHEWSKIGHGYEEKADARAKAGAPGAELAELYMHGFDACRVGRYPTPNSPGKLEAYRHSLRMFRKAAKYFDPPLEIVELPFGDTKLIGYLQRPPGVTRPPVVLHWGGVDGWKEDRLRIAKSIMDAGLASMTIDMPGSGENPVLYSHPEAERTYLTWLDYLPQRIDIDGKRVAVWGGSFGAYWAARPELPHPVRHEQAHPRPRGHAGPVALRGRGRRRRTFAIISHPDAGKTTLTEKLLLFGGAIQLAGQVKAKRDRRSTRSDWMAVERERGISVVTSVMTFEYDGRVFNLLDTPATRTSRKTPIARSRRSIRP
jgi:hypothetical protein